MSPRSVLALALFLLLAGCDDSKTPLSDPGASKPDEKLAGVWRFRGENGKVGYYHIGQASEKLPEGVMRVVGVMHREGKIEPPSELLMFPTTLDGKTYLNVTGGKEEQVKLLEEKGWKAVEAYFIFKYKVEGDKLLVWVMDGDVKKRAIESGKIKGVIEKNKPAKFTDTTENLARFVAQAGDSLFPNQPIRLERVEVGPPTTWWGRAEAIAEIERRGGRVTVDGTSPDRSVIGVSLYGTKATDAELEPLKALTNLQSLDLAWTNVTDVGLENLRGLAKLQDLSLMGTKVTDAGLEHLEELTGLQRLSLAGTKVSSAGLKHIKGLTNIQRLDLCSTAAGDAGLEYLGSLAKLQTLDLWNAKVNDAGLKHLAALTQLQSLNLNGNNITDAGLENLTGLTRLRSLQLGEAKVTGTGLKHLEKLTKLQSLGLWNTGVDDAGLQHIEGLTTLERLWLNDTKVTDAGLEHLIGLTNLQTLSLVGTKVTDKGLEHLKGMTNLKTLGLDHTQVTDEGVRNLQKALPNCEVTH